MANFIAIEGADRCGKQTQSKMLTEALAKRGYNVRLMEVPVNDGVTYRLIYWMLKNGTAKRLPNLFQFVQFLNKLIFQVTWLFWLSYTNDYVIFDRWSLSSVVYGNATGTNRTFVRFLYELLKKPDMTIVLHGARHTEDTEDVYERDTVLQQNVRKGYLDWALRFPSNHELIDNQGTRDDVHVRLMNSLGFIVI